ncbi:MAG TPA: transcription-repair coupling factor [Chthoniobacterales bacterium]
MGSTEGTKNSKSFRPASAPAGEAPGLRWLERVGETAPFQKRLAKESWKQDIEFQHVTEAAQPFLASLLALKVPATLWIVCQDVRQQERIHNEMLAWFGETLFLPEMEAIVDNTIPDPEISAERLDVLQRLARSNREVVVLTRATLESRVPALAALKSQSIRLARSQRMDRDGLIDSLAKGGYERVAQVSLRGQFAVRGGILDVFSWQHTQPVRLEFFDDEIESIRIFDLDEQRSFQTLDVCQILTGDVESETVLLRTYIRKDHIVVDVETDVPDATIRITGGAFISDEAEDYSGAFFEHSFGEFEPGDLIVEAGKREALFQQFRQWDRDGWTMVLLCHNEGEAERFRDLLGDNHLDLKHLTFAEGSISQGFTYPEAKLAVLADGEIFGRYHNNRSKRLALRRARIQSQRAQIDFSELTEGDYVVHLEHGIARFEGLQKFEQDGRQQEVLVLEFAEEAKMYVPLEQAFMVSRYVGVGKKSPDLSKLGDSRWAKAKKDAEKAVFDYAARLLQVQAERETAAGHAFPVDSKWQHEFESAFLYKETPDQLTAIQAAKADMESTRPMDRLICGDVGFGKTEVAIRAAFKAVMGGKQIAILVPTTVLAQQHFHNFKERMSDYPVKIEMLSRFRTAAAQKKTLAGVADGTVDIVIGTHRLISKDVQFKNLGLVVVDEEQRFGVLHKEKFKELFQLIDVLTLSATPIPRTLYLSLMGARDISTIETPPQNRLPVETVVCGYDERIIRDAIRRELGRKGQVYFLHNRVHSIEHIATRIRHLVPEARIGIGHGQMNEHELEDVMQKFVDGDTDILISTTIIESGLDIPNANTIIIDRADRFGLADLYQLRGRVGRAHHKAYAYLLLPRDQMTAGAARKRVNAIKQYSSLGAGFKIAMRDLEIRGAGNVLGTAQSGHIISVGFDLYCQLLKQAVAKMKGEKVRPRLEVVTRLDFVALNESEWINDPHLAPAFLPASYISEPETRISAYRKLAEVTSRDALEDLRKVWRDRFGPLPEAAGNLLVFTEIKLTASNAKIARLEVREEKVMLTRGGDFILVGGKFPRLTAGDSGEKLDALLELLRKI